MGEKKKILIVDDNEINCSMLEHIFRNEYEVLIAYNGKEALNILSEHSSQICAIILDLLMPVMNGYDFLEQMRLVDKYSNIPVIVVTVDDDCDSEKKALSLGAWDFIKKPYDNDIIKFRLRNAIERSQLSAFNKLKYLSEFDNLTGIYNRNKFYTSTSHMLIDNEDKPFYFIRFDISRFSLINSYYGVAKGDELLIYIAKSLMKLSEDYEYFTYGRIESDVFAMCVEVECESECTELLEKMDDMLKHFPIDFDILSSYGIYIVENHRMDISIMLDYAFMATKSIKGNYVKNSAVYSERMRKNIEAEQEIINEMSFALKDRQFCVYLQPKYDIYTNLPVGAEALVRWNHPVKGMISPGVFIPVFERNGFISKLDYYVWEEVVKLLRKWMDEGRNPMSVSVNISRVNIYNSDLVSNICGLVDKYHVPRRLLHLELTESAYTQDPVAMRETLLRLHEEGFTVLMDDFGSGYSSLNMLKDIKIDILKIDMEFFRNSGNAGRGKDIVASVVNMAKCLKIPSIAEGVEREEQIEFLRNIGCEYVQGYYYSKPIPVDEFEQMLNKAEEFTRKSIKKDIIDEDEILSNVRNICKESNAALGMYQYNNGSLDILYENAEYCKLLGYGEVDRIKKDGPLSVVESEHIGIVTNAMQKAIDTRSEVSTEYLRTFLDGRKRWINMSIRYIKSIGDNNYLIGNLSDITDLREVKQKVMSIL